MGRFTGETKGDSGSKKFQNLLHHSFFKWPVFPMYTCQLMVVKLLIKSYLALEGRAACNLAIVTFAILLQLL